MAAKKKTKGGSAKLVCPKKVKVGKKIKNVVASQGSCHVTRKDGTKSRVRKVKRGHKGYGSFSKSGKKK